MQIPPITFTDISILLAVGAILLAISYQLTSPYFGATNLAVNKRKLRKAALIVSVLFLITAAINIAVVLIGGI